MPLLCYNLTGAPITLAASSAGTTVVIPASSSAPNPGPPFNVTSKIRGLTGTQYSSLEAQRAGNLSYQWTSTPEYSIGTLLAVPAISSAISPVPVPSIMTDSSCILWLDPGINPTVDRVTQLATQISDRSASANHATAAGGASPITNGQIFAGAPGVFLDGAATFLTLTSQITTARTIMIAYQSAGLPPANTPILGSTVASATTDFAGSASGVAMFLVGGVGANLADGKVDINGRRYIMRDAPGVYFGPARPTAPSIVTITGTGSLRFDTISKDRGNSRWDKANIGMLVVWNRVLTTLEQWTAERWLANELRARGAALPLDITRRRQVVFEGDSQTFGGSAYYPDYVFGEGTTKGFYGSNVAQAGTCIGSKDGAGGAYPAGIGTPFMLTRQAANVLSLLQPTADINIACFRGGTNDLANGAGKAQTLANILAWLDAARAAGFKTFWDPMLDRTAAMPNYIGSNGFTADRNDINTQMITTYANRYDATMPAAYLAHAMMADGAPNSTTYFDVDKLHPNKVGQQVNAFYKVTVLNSMM